MLLPKLLAVLAFITLPAAAQNIAMGGSESYMLQAPSVVGGGGVAVSFSYIARVVIEAPSVPFQIVSETRRMLAGPALFGAEPTGAPILFGVREGTGVKNGGQAVTLFGRDLNALGSGASAATFGGQPLSSLSVTSGLTATGFTSPGVNVFGNPLGSVDVRFTNQFGSTSRQGAFAYTPALVLDSLPVVGHGYGLSLHAPPGSTISMAYGIATPGVALPLFNLDGALEILQQITIFVPFSPTPTSGHFQFAAAIPPAPNLVGLKLPLQAVAITDLGILSGSFTNKFLLQIQ